MVAVRSTSSGGPNRSMTSAFIVSGMDTLVDAMLMTASAGSRCIASAPPR